MALINAKQAAVNIKNPQSVDEYLNTRIEAASAKGYSSVRVWVRAENLKEAKTLLGAGGYSHQTLVTEDNGNEQLEVTWG